MQSRQQTHAKLPPGAATPSARRPVLMASSSAAPPPPQVLVDCVGGRHASSAGVAPLLASRRLVFHPAYGWGYDSWVDDPSDFALAGSSARCVRSAAAHRACTRCRDGASRPPRALCLPAAGSRCRRWRARCTPACRRWVPPSSRACRHRLSKSSRRVSSSSTTTRRRERGERHLHHRSSHPSGDGGAQARGARASSPGPRLAANGRPERRGHGP